MAVALAFGSGSAWAEDDDDVPLDTKLFRRVMKELGFRNGDEGIEYRERAPLVVPPSRNLPPPQGEAAATRDPAWPKDPDVARRRAETAAEKAKLRRSGDFVSENARTLRPDELKGNPAAATSSNEPTRPSAEEAARPLNPSQLSGGGKSWLDTTLLDLRSATAGKRAIYRRAAPNEHDRTASRLSDAFASQPYGVGVEYQKAKPQTVESRMEPPK